MNRGLAEFDDNDRIFNNAFPDRILLSGAFTGAWFVFAKRFHFFNSPHTLRYSLPFAAILSFYFSKGFVYHYIAAKQVTGTVQLGRKNELCEYKKGLTNNNVHA
jgi:hypothetical protein